MVLMSKRLRQELPRRTNCFFRYGINVCKKGSTDSSGELSTSVISTDLYFIQCLPC